MYEAPVYEAHCRCMRHRTKLACIIYNNNIVLYIKQASLAMCLIHWCLIHRPKLPVYETKSYAIYFLVNILNICSMHTYACTHSLFYIIRAYTHTGTSFLVSLSFYNSSYTHAPTLFFLRISSRFFSSRLFWPIFC